VSAVVLLTGYRGGVCFSAGGGIIDSARDGIIEGTRGGILIVRAMVFMTVRVMEIATEYRRRYLGRREVEDG
jgi:hypothetical protein